MIAVDGADASQPASPVIEWAGCAGIRRGPVCDLGTDRHLTIWIGDAGRGGWTVLADASVVRVDGASQTTADGGTRVTVDVPMGSSRLGLRDQAGIVRWSLPLGAAARHDDIDRLVAAGRTGKYQASMKALEALRAAALPSDRGPLDAAIGRMALGLGQVERAEPALRASIAAARAEGRLADVVRDGAGLLWALVHLQQRYVDARVLLEDMTWAGAQYPEGRVWLDYHAGLLAADTADVRTALDRYRRAERSARRLGMTSLAEDAAMEVARLLTRIGRTDEALPLLKALSVPADACARAARTLNLVWASVEHQAMRPSPAGAAAEHAAIHGADAATRACPNPHWRLLATVYAAEAAMLEQDDAAAWPLIREIQAAPVDRDVLRASRRAEVLGRWFLHRRQPVPALAAFESQLPAARARGLLEEQFRAQIGAGRALLALGHRAAAVARLEAAQSLLETMLRGVPLAEGRGSFLSGRDEGVRYLVGALVDGGAIRQALRTARWARAAELAHAARLDRLAGLSTADRRRWDQALGRYQRLRADIERDAENDWTVPRAEIAGRRSARQAQSEQARAALDDAFRLLVKDRGLQDIHLSDPARGELLVACFPGPQGWFLFTSAAGHSTVVRIADADLSTAAGAETVLARIDAPLAAARRVRLLLYGAADGVDWQAVPWRGRPLLASVPVAYGVDLGVAPDHQGGQSAAAASAPVTTHAPQTQAAAAMAPAPPTALIVSNPTGDLSATLAEADAVQAALIGWQVTRLDGAAATRAAVLATLPSARLFHYAGHAQISQSDGLSSALLLRGNTRVELGDLLAAPAVPALVVLPACEAAGQLEGGRSLMGLAQAFIASGTRMAVAPARPVGDADAAAFVRAFYLALGAAAARRGTTLGRASADDLVEYGHAAFRDAGLAVSAQTGNVPGAGPRDGFGWQSFRLLIP